MSPLIKIAISISDRWRSMVPGFARFVIRRRYPLLILTTVLFIVSAFYIATHFKLAEGVKDDLPPDDPEIIRMNKFIEDFGGEEFLVIAFEGEQVFTPQLLTHMRNLTAKFEKLEKVKEVLSLTNALEIRGADGMIEVEPFIDQNVIPTDPLVLTDLERRALANHFWVNSLISEDAEAAAINLKLPILEDDATYRIALVEDIRRIMRENPAPEGYDSHFTGVSVFGTDSMEAMEYDFWHFMLFLPVMVLVLMFIVFRSFRGVFIPQVIIFKSVAYTLFIFFLSGHAITMISTMLPVLIGVIAISDVIHVIARYYEESQHIRERKALVQATVEHMMPPCFLTSTTTAAGFASLMISDVTQVRVFGLFSAIGLMLAFLVSMTVGTIILTFLPVPPAKQRKVYATGFFNRVLDRVDKYTARDNFVIPLFAVIGFGCAIFGILHLRVETNLAKFLPQDKPSVTGLNWLQDKMAGVTTLDMTLEGPPGVFKEPWALREMQALAEYLESTDEVNKVYSTVDFIRILHRVFNDDDPAYDRIPDSREAVAQLLLMFESTDGQELLDQFVVADYDYTRMTARIRSMGSAGHLALIEHVQKYAETRLDPRLKLNTTGVVVLYATITTALVNGQIYSLGIAFIIITIMMILHLRSLKIGLLSMLPNMFPIMITLGVMGMMEISLNVATVMIACIALGIAVDDTIHYLSRYGAELEEGKSLSEAMRRTIMGAGRGMVFTSLVITGGFFVLCFSSFHTNRAFGILTGITMITAVFADLLLLPVLIRLLRIGK